MKLRIGGLMLVFFSLVLPMAAQDTRNTISPPYKKIVWNNTTVTLTGPNTTTGDAPTVLSVTGGAGGGGRSPAGGGIALTGGTGGTPPGPGGAIALTSGAGGKFGGGAGGEGGSIQITGGTGEFRICSPASGCPSWNGGEGGSIQITGGNPATHSGGGGSINLQPGLDELSSNNGSVNLAPSGGDVGIGNSSPAATLDIVSGGTTLADAWTTRSSRRFKTNIQPIQGALEKVEQLQGVSYERKADGKHEIGVVAEDVDEVVPEVVSRDPKSQEVQGVDYSRLAALLIEAVKSQQAEIQQLKMQVLQLTSNRAGN